jgi:hypothetical protein
VRIYIVCDLKLTKLQYTFDHLYSQTKKSIFLSKSTLKLSGFIEVMFGKVVFSRDNIEEYLFIAQHQVKDVGDTRNLKKLKIK